MLGEVTDIIALGIGLYLALGVVQAVSAGGVAGLRRRATTLQTAVRSAKLVSQYSVVNSLQAKISRLEIGFEALNRTVLVAVTALFFIGVVGFVIAALSNDQAINWTWVSLIVFYYIVAPLLIYVVTSIVISKKCTDTREDIKNTEDQVKRLLLS